MPNLARSIIASTPIPTPQVISRPERPSERIVSRVFLVVLRHVVELRQGKIELAFHAGNFRVRLGADLAPSFCVDFFMRVGPARVTGSVARMVT